MLTYYSICFFISALVMLFYILIYRSHFSVYFTLLEIFVPLVNLGCLWMASASGLREGIIANRVVYIGGCYLTPLVLFALFEICDIKPPRWLPIIAFFFATVIYLTVIFSDYTGVFYKSIDYHIAGDVLVLDKQYGFMHTICYILIGLYVAAGIALLVYCIFKKRKASMKNLYLVLSFELVTAVLFFVVSIKHIGIEPSAFYTLSQIAFTISANRIHFYNINENISEIISRDGSLGYMTFDNGRRFLTSNETAELWFPEITALRTDRTIDNNEGINGLLVEWFPRIDNGEKRVYDILKSGNLYIEISMDAFAMTSTKRGYRVSMRDDTDHQKLVSLLNDQKIKAERERRRISNTLERYIDPSIMKALLQDSEGTITAGREHNIAILFADIRGFTSLSETRQAYEVIELLNRCLEVMVACIIQNRGALDKFMGDCAMAFWNDTNEDGEAAYLACKAAMDMKVASRQMNTELEEKYGIKLKIGVGINYGTAIIGNVGTDMRSDYTVIGDTVNVASRLEDMAKSDEILITSQVADIIKYRSKLSSIGKSVKLHGKSNQVEVFRLEELGGRK